MTVDRFLGFYFRTSERRASPPSIAGRDHASTYGQAEHAASAYVWALSVMGTIERSGALTSVQVGVLRHFYLNLSNAHVSIVERRFQGAEPRIVQVREVTAGAPDAAADLESYCDWGALARACGVPGRSPATEARRMFAEARHVVAAELARRESESGGDIEVTYGA